MRQEAIFLAQCLIGFWMVLIPANLAPVSLGLAGGVLLLAIGLVATSAQLLMTWSYGKISIVTGSLIGLLTPAINVVVGVAIFQESLSLSETFGTLVILASCIGIVLIGEEKK
jgi:drug/metabolite transporter (DMT)-like permease